MRSLDEILELIQDSRWRSVEEVRKELSLPDEKFIDKDNGRLRITSRGLKLLGLPT